MNNIVGQPVDGEDFFDRQRELAEFWGYLQEGNNLLLLAPRRVGKTSLALRLGENARHQCWRFVWMDAERDRDELSFLANLLESLLTAGLKLPLLARVSRAVDLVRRQLTGKIEGMGVSVDLGDTGNPEPARLEHWLDQLFSQLDASSEPILIGLDELPVFLTEMLRDDPSAGRIRDFLNWFRAVRLRYRKRVRWLLLGSVGLDSFAETHRLTPAINDLNPVSLGAYSPNEAVALLQALGRGKNLDVNEAVCQEVLRQVGWPLPFFLQLMFQRLHANASGCNRPLETADVHRAFEQLTGAAFYKHFEPWRGRLAEGLGPDEYKAATAVLRALCEAEQGLDRPKLLDVVRAKFPQRDGDETARLLAAVLGQLERDGYLARATDGASARYVFRSFLLRRYWQAREIL